MRFVIERARCEPPVRWPRSSTARMPPMNAGARVAPTPNELASTIVCATRIRLAGRGSIALPIPMPPPDPTALRDTLHGKQQYASIGDVAPCQAGHASAAVGGVAVPTVTTEAAVCRARRTNRSTGSALPRRWSAPARPRRDQRRWSHVLSMRKSSDAAALTGGR